MAFKVFFDDEFYRVYTSDPAAASGRMEAIVNKIQAHVEFQAIQPAAVETIALVHSKEHIKRVKKQGLHELASLAAGGACQAARLGIEEPCFALIRPPGHHASSGNAWGFCFYNNMAIAIEALKQEKRIESACILDIDMHFGDGTYNILKSRDYVTVHNIETEDRVEYLKEVKEEMASCRADIIGISAGFDNHVDDWGGVLETSDYREIGSLVAKTVRQNQSGVFAILEGGYNHSVLGVNTLALIEGLSD